MSWKPIDLYLSTTEPAYFVFVVTHVNSEYHLYRFFFLFVSHLLLLTFTIHEQNKYNCQNWAFGTHEFCSCLNKMIIADAKPFILLNPEKKQSLQREAITVIYLNVWDKHKESTSKIPIFTPMNSIVCENTKCSNTFYR